MPDPIALALHEYFTRLHRELEHGQVPHEKALSERVAIPDPAHREPPLLEALGYHRGVVRPEYPGGPGWQRARTREKVDFRIQARRGFSMLEIKHPHKALDTRSHVGQLQFYLDKDRQPNRENQWLVPIGILFNGREALAFLNPDHRALADYKGLHAHFRRLPVATAVLSGDAKQMVRFFSAFRQAADLVGLARRLAQAFERQIQQTERIEQIRVQLAKIERASLPAQVADAFIEASPGLARLSASAKEVREAWSLMHQPEDVREAGQPITAGRVGAQRLFDSAKIKPGDPLIAASYTDEVAHVVDGKTVRYGGRLMSYSKWGLRVTGWQSISIFQSVTHIRTGKLLRQLRDELESETPE